MTNAQLNEVWSLDMALFGSATVSVEEGRRWHAAYPGGIFVCEVAGKLTGYMSLWPIRAGDYDALVSGALRESAFTVRHIAPYAGEPRSHWYFGSIASREPAHTRSLVIQSFQAWATRLPDGGVAHVAASAFSEQGRRFLERCNFVAPTEGSEFWYRFFSAAELSSLRSGILPWETTRKTQ